MAMLSYYSHSKSVRVKVVAQPSALASAAARAPAVSKRLKAVHTALHANAERLGDLFAPIHETAETMVVVQTDPKVTLLATETLTVESPTKSDLQLLKDKYGMEVVREGLFGKVLLRNPNEAGEEAVEQVFKSAAAVYKRGKVEAAHPNFVRVIDHIQRKAPGAAAAATAAAAPWWNHLNDGSKGVRGADAAVRAAWTIHRGDEAIRVAVLDEGVDVDHPDLKDAVIAQKDFVDGNPTAAPSGNDAHGTACAGIILGRGDQFQGITGCALVAVRIAKDDGSGGWVFDDFATADAIDWSWN